MTVNTEEYTFPNTSTFHTFLQWTTLFSCTTTMQNKETINTNNDAVYARTQVKAAKYALSPDPKGQARGGTVGARYAAAQLGIPEPQSVREWMKRLPEMEEALERAQADGGETGSRHARRKKSMSRGRVRAL